MSDTNAVNPRTLRKQQTGRGSIAKREWIDSSGQVADEEAATGFKYTYLDDESRPYIFQFDLSKKPEAGDTLVMCAIFGGLTLAGNVVNSTKDGEDPIENIRARFEQIDSEGVWVSREGVFGPRIDLDVLARAISLVKHGSEHEAHTYRAKMGSTVLVENRSKKYEAAAMTIPEVQAKYRELKPKTTPTASLGDL